MNPLLGWALALVLVVVGWRSYGVAGLALAASVIVFWLMLQFSRVMRVMNTGVSMMIPFGWFPIIGHVFNSRFQISHRGKIEKR